MLRQASKRNTAAIRAARVTLMRALVDQIAPALDGPFDAILAVNCLGFWPAPAERLAELRRRLAPGGRVAIASRPRLPRGHGGHVPQRRPRNRGPAERRRFRAPEHPDPRNQPPVACVLAAGPAPDTSDIP